MKSGEKNVDDSFVVGAVLTDLSIAFDCIAHNLLIAKLPAYNFSDEDLSYIYSCLTDGRHCVCIKNTDSQHKTTAPGLYFWVPSWG